MDWAAIASVLGERNDRPLVLLDRTGRIRMFNRAIEHVLGWSRFEVEGELWTRVCTAPERQDETRRWLGDAMRGALWSFEAYALTNTGGQVKLRLESSLVGRGTSQGLLLTVTQWQAAESSNRIVPGSDLDYDITIEPTMFGALEKLVVDSEPIRVPEDARCYASIHGQQRPCENCPALRSDNEPWPRVSVQHVADEDGGAAFEIKSAQRIDGSLVRIRKRTITDHTLEAIHAAKIQQLSDRAELSAREREILTYLLLGRNIEDIGMLVGIAARTVKYHQANVLQKLGADSRADLMRLLF